MADPLLDKDALDEALRLVTEEAARYLAQLDEAPVRPPARASRAAPAGALPAEGDGLGGGAARADRGGPEGATRSAGPALLPLRDGRRDAGGARRRLVDERARPDRLQLGRARRSRCGSSRSRSTGCKELFGLPAGVERRPHERRDDGELHRPRGRAPLVGRCEQGVDVEEEGLAGLPPVPGARQRLRARERGEGARDAGHRAPAGAVVRRGRERPARPRRARRRAARPGRRAGDPRRDRGRRQHGGFDPIDAMADLAAEHGAWLHVDGAFGLFAAVSPSTRELVRGVERAHSVVVDGHKWLNVPYDCGAVFVHDRALHEGAFAAAAAYLGSEERRPTCVQQPLAGDVAPGAGAHRLGDAAGVRARRLPRDGRAPPRARAAAGRRRWTPTPSWSGSPTSRSTSSASATAPPASPSRARRAEPPPRPGGPRRRPRLLRHHGEAGKVAFRPAIVNWRTGPEDVDLIVPTIRELGAALAA